MSKLIWKKTGLYGLLFFMLSIGFAISHETTHKYIYEANGCEAEINYLPSKVGDNIAFMSTHGDCSGISEEKWKRVQDYQMTVEAVGYQILPVLSVLYLILVAVIESNTKERVVDLKYHQFEEVKK